ncbi:hypothetical protein BDY24DRAFT_400979 [Mrakia frigida]|uniref:uncharacterized protein n=1 Tax=Mrakia frigida TaxID=29902 RepID=UPI003FCC1D13
MTSALFSTRLALTRSAAYLAFIALDIVLFGLLAEFYPLASYSHDGYYGVIIILFAALSAFSLIVVPLFVFVLPASLKKPCVVKALWFDLCWLVLLTGLWLAATVCWTVVHGSLKEDYCPTEGYQYGLPDGYTREQYCSRLEALLAFTWIDTIWIGAILVGSIVFGVVQAKRGNRPVWTRPVIEAPLTKHEASRPIVLEG